MWFDCNEFLHEPTTVYTNWDDCIKTIEERLSKVDRVWRIETSRRDCKANGMNVYAVYGGKNYDYEIHIHWVNIA